MFPLSRAVSNLMARTKHFPNRTRPRNQTDASATVLSSPTAGPSKNPTKKRSRSSKLRSNPKKSKKPKPSFKRIFNEQEELALLRRISGFALKGQNLSKHQKKDCFCKKLKLEIPLGHTETQIHDKVTNIRKKFKNIEKLVTKGEGGGDEEVCREDLDLWKYIWGKNGVFRKQKEQDSQSSSSEATEEAYHEHVLQNEDGNASQAEQTRATLMLTRDGVNQNPSSIHSPTIQDDTNDELNRDCMDHSTNEEDNQNDEFDREKDDHFPSSTCSPLGKDNPIERDVVDHRLSSNLSPTIFNDITAPIHPPNNQNDEVEKETDVFEEQLESIERKEVFEPSLADGSDPTEINVCLDDESNSKNKSEARSNPLVSRKKLLVLDLNGVLADIAFDIKGRPFCEDFLKFCFDKFEVGIWSSKIKKNVERVGKCLFRDMWEKKLFCWDRSHCTVTGVECPENENNVIVFKDLNMLWETLRPEGLRQNGDYNETNTVLVDDSPYKAMLNPEHTAIFPQTYHRDMLDKSLASDGDLRLYLEKLAEAENVQEFIKENHIGQNAITDTSEDWLTYKWAKCWTKRTDV